MKHGLVSESQWSDVPIAEADRCRYFGVQVQVQPGSVALVPRVVITLSPRGQNPGTPDLCCSPPTFTVTTCSVPTKPQSACLRSPVDYASYAAVFHILSSAGRVGSPRSAASGIVVRSLTRTTSPSWLMIDTVSTLAPWHSPVLAASLNQGWRESLDCMLQLPQLLMLPSRLSLEQLVSLVLNDDTHAAATDSNDLHALDAAVVSPAKSLEASVQHIADDGAPHAGASSLTVVMYSCLAALVSVSAVMCVRIYLRKRALRAQVAWELLPRTSDVGAYSDSESSLPKSQEDMLDSTAEDADAHLLATPALLDVKQHPNPWLSPMGSMAARDIPDFDFPNLITFGDQSSDTSSIETIIPTDLIDVTEDEEDVEDTNEFFDASTDLLQPTPLPQSTPLPESTRQSEPIPLPVITISQVGTIEDDSDDPPLPSLGPGPLIREPVVTARPHSPAHRPHHMRELSLAPISRPAWSLRADDDSSLFVPPASKSTDIALSPLMPVESLPPSPVHAPSSPSADAFALAVPPPKRRRAFRSPVPEFDIALAMQLRPGLGANADAAWMVRFIMTIFGFLSVMWTNHSNRFTPIKMRQQRIAA